jgi:hypothetical protein
MNSAPGRSDRLRYEDIRRTIDELHSAYGLRVVIFAGGEPTLLGQDLLDAIAYADTQGILTRLVTNGYWAVSEARAREKLIELREAGLAELNVSADDYHLPYVPFERVEHAWRASKGLGFLSVVIANCSGPGSVVTPAFIMDRLGETPDLRYDDDGYQRPIGARAPDGTYYALSNGQVQMLGRANEEISEADLTFRGEEARLDGGCRWAIRSAALSPKNHLVACCGTEAEDNPVLDFGSLHGQKATERVEFADDQLIVNAIALRGPLFLKEFIQAHRPSVAFRDRYASVCEICEHIVKRPEAVRVLREESFDLAVEVLGARAALEDDAARRAARSADLHGHN